MFWLPCCIVNHSYFLVVGSSYSLKTFFQFQLTLTSRNSALSLLRTPPPKLPVLKSHTDDKTLRLRRSFVTHTKYPWATMSLFRSLMYMVLFYSLFKYGRSVFFLKFSLSGISKACLWLLKVNPTPKILYF